MEEEGKWEGIRLVRNQPGVFEGGVKKVMVKYYSNLFGLKVKVGCYFYCE